VLGVPDCVAEAETEEKAILEAQHALKSKLAASKVITVEMDVECEYRRPNPLLRMAGRFKDDPGFDNMMEEIARYRTELDAEMEKREAEDTTQHPLLEYCGALANDPTLDGRQEKMAEFRRQDNEIA
jgi:hypothetical protein